MPLLSLHGFTPQAFPQCLLPTAWTLGIAHLDFALPKASSRLSCFLPLGLTLLPEFYHTSFPPMFTTRSLASRNCPPPGFARQASSPLSVFPNSIALLSLDLNTPGFPSTRNCPRGAWSPTGLVHLRGLNLWDHPRAFPFQACSQLGLPSPRLYSPGHSPAYLAPSLPPLRLLLPERCLPVFIPWFSPNLSLPPRFDFLASVCLSSLSVEIVLPSVCGSTNYTFCHVIPTVPNLYLLIFCNRLYQRNGC